MKRRDDIEKVMGMLDDDIVGEYLEAISKPKRRSRSLRVMLVAAVAAVLLAIPLAVGVMMRGGQVEPPIGTDISTDAPVPPVTDSGEAEPEGKFSVLSVSASRMDSQGFIYADTSFLIRTENGSVDRVRMGIHLDPAFDYEVLETDEDECFEIVPTEEIPDNTLVKVSEVEDQVVINSWAFQTREILSVSGTFPANGTMNNDVHTTVEIEFTYASVENIEDYVTIVPDVAGEWEHFGKTWRFTPYTSFEAETDYTVTVKPGITAADDVIEDPYVFFFGTHPLKSADTFRFTSELTTVDNINTYRPGDKISMMFRIHREIKKSDGSIQISEASPALVCETVKNITLERFDSAEEFIGASSGANAYQTEQLGEFGYICELLAVDSADVYVISLDSSLSEGYYRAAIRGHSDEIYAEWFIQVHPMSVYSIMTAHDMLLWVADGDKVAEDVPVSVFGEDLVTGEDGTLTVDISDKDSLDGEYIRIGDSEFPLVVGIDSISCKNPIGYIYADKLKYRPDDTINIWGYVPLSAIPKTADGKFEIIIDEGSVTIPVTLDENGTFSLSYKLENFSHMWTKAELLMDGSSIASRVIEIKDYEDENYTYEFFYEKNYVRVGDTIEFDVKVTHVSGLPAAGKKLRSKAGTATTDENGIAHFEYSTEGHENSFGANDYMKYENVSVDPFNITVYSGNAEESYSEGYSKTFYVILKDEILETSLEGSVITVKTNKVREPESGIATSVSDFIGEPIDRTITVDIYENHVERYVKEHVYDPYTKLNVPKYDTRSTKSIIDTFEVETVDGVWFADLRDHEKNEDTEDDRYDYGLAAHYEAGEEEIPLVTHTIYFRDTLTMESASKIGSFYQHHDNTWGPYGHGTGNSYRSYKYMLKISDEVSSVDAGDRVSLELLGYNGAPTDSGQVMRLLYQNEVIRADILSWDEDMGFTFEEEMFPGVTVTGVYFRDGVFYRMPLDVVGISSQQRNMNIEIKTDRESYSPGDIITVDITVTDEDGNPIKNTAVNMSVMNSASDVIPKNNIDDIKTPYYYDCYTFSSHRDYDIYTPPGGSGGGGNPTRSIFLDSPYFGNPVTDENGKATVTFTLPDNITEYTITVHGANKDWYTGSARTTFKITKEFFIQQIVPYGIKASDDFVVNALCNSNVIADLSAVISVKETNQSFTLDSKTGVPFEANFGKLPVGTYTVRIEAESGESSDAIEYPVTVVESAQKFSVTSHIDLDGETVLKPASNPVLLEITTDAYDRYRDYLAFLGVNLTERSDTKIAYTEGNRIMEELSATSYSTVYTGGLSVGENNILRPLNNAEEDDVLTALTLMLSPKSLEKLYSSGSAAEIIREYLEDVPPKSLTSVAEKLLLAAAGGEPVLKDLRYMADTIEDDDYIEMILALGFVASGDYTSAREMYLKSASDPGNEGYGALRAICATYIDKEHAADMIDLAIETEPSEYYLGLAVTAFMKNRCGLSDEEMTVTVTCGEYTEEISVRGLEVKTVTIVTEELEDVVITSESEYICMNYTCVMGIDDIENASEAIRIDLADSVSEDGGIPIKMLRVDLSRLDNAEGTINIVLPDALRVENYPFFNGGYYIKRSGVNTIEIQKPSRSSVENAAVAQTYQSVIEIPLIIRSTGEFEFEPVVLVTDGGEIYSSNTMTVELSGK